VADQDLVTVFVPEEPTQLALVESVLRQHGIPYAAHSSEIQNLYGAGEIGAYNSAIGPVAIQVAAADLERSREILSETLGAAAEHSVAPASDAPTAAEAQAFRYARYSIVWGVVWLGGVGSLLALYFGFKALSLGEASRVSSRRAKFGLAIGGAGVILRLVLWGSSFLG
jgi:hypothetical protein